MTLRTWAHVTRILAVLALTGCRHQARVAVLASAPILMISVPPPTHQSEPSPPLEAELLLPLGVLVPRQPLPRFRPRPTTAHQLAFLLPASPPTVFLGELSTGGESADIELRQQTEALLRGQQERLGNLPRAVVALHPQQIAQTRLFLKEALEAWRSRDLEGAHVLALKTKLLLDEL